jgi:hypothetical protein
MPWIPLKDGRRVWLEEWQIAMIEAEPPELGKWLREDAAAFAAQRRSLPQSANVTPVGAPKAVTPGEPVKPSGFVEALPLKTPYVDEVDRVAKAFEQRERIEQSFVRRKLK